ncbi:MAG TPA: DUF3703 domain-containing protein [Firmicutes bacterium]|nr:DUF3703 domain-containing protein [Bacillota bacterium]
MNSCLIEHQPEHLVFFTFAPIIGKSKKKVCQTMRLLLQKLRHIFWAIPLPNTANTPHVGAREFVPPTS